MRQLRALPQLREQLGQLERLLVRLALGLRPQRLPCGFVRRHQFPESLSDRRQDRWQACEQSGSHNSGRFLPRRTQQGLPQLVLQALREQAVPLVLQVLKGQVQRVLGWRPGLAVLPEQPGLPEQEEW